MKKLVFSLIQAVLLALIGYVGVVTVADDYTKAASDGVSVVAQKYLKESEGTGENLSQDEAIQKAEKDVRIGNRVKAAPTSVIQRKAVSTAMVGGAGGFVTWIIVFWLTIIMTKPMDTLLDSAWGNFARFYLGSTTITYIIMGVYMFLSAEIFFENL